MFWSVKFVILIAGSFWIRIQSNIQLCLCDLSAFSISLNSEYFTSWIIKN